MKIKRDTDFQTEEQIYAMVKTMTDKELKEFQAVTSYHSMKSLRRTEKNVAFFFYLTLASMFLIAGMYMITK